MLAGQLPRQGGTVVHHRLGQPGGPLGLQHPRLAHPEVSGQLLHAPALGDEPGQLLAIDGRLAPHLTPSLPLSVYAYTSDVR